MDTPKAHNRFARLICAALLISVVGGCSNKAEDAPEKAAPKMMPQSQAVMFGAGSADEGERLYGQECAFCHAGRNTGTVMLGRRMDPAQAELHKRTDLEADYVKAVVRNGLVNMPPFSKIELSDEELEKVAAYLARGGKK
jgi:cytochrome c5